MKLFYKFPKITSIEETLDYIILNKVSFARFGDGEFNLISEKSIGFQKGNSKLSTRLKEVLTEKQTYCIICIPETISHLQNININAKLVWMHLIGNFYKNYECYLDKNLIYHNSLITRPYMDLLKKNKSEIYFNKLKQIWNNKHILIVEGENSKLGIGNDLFNNVNSINRIVTKRSNAFDLYEDLFTEITKQSTTVFILLSLGPTATVLAFDLAKLGYQVGDVGHVDIEYEWFLKKSNKKSIVTGKNVNELNYNPSNNDLLSDVYNKQIIAKIL